VQKATPYVESFRLSKISRTTRQQHFREAQSLTEYETPSK
jgi:hypothetical protein